MQNIWLSVLIPVYNVEKYLACCINSVLSQDCSGVEIILLNDCSTDSSLVEAKKLQDQSPELVRIVEHEENRGLSAARNSLLEHATGEYVWYFDSDDLLLDGAIASLAKVSDAHSPDCIMFDYFRISEASKYPSINKISKRVSTFVGPENVLMEDKARLFEGMFLGRRLHACSRIIKREVLLNSQRYPEGKYFEDVYTIPMISLNFKNYYYLQKELLGYRIRKDSIVRSPTLKKIDDMAKGPLGVYESWCDSGVEFKLRHRYAFVKFCAMNFVNTIKMLKDSGFYNRARREEYRELFLKGNNISFFEFAWMSFLRRDFACFYRFILYNNFK